MTRLAHRFVASLDEFGVWGWLLGVVAGIGVWVEAATSQRPEWAPSWIGWPVAIIGMVVVAVGTLGFLHAVRASRRGESPRVLKARAASGRFARDLDDLAAQEARRQSATPRPAPLRSNASERAKTAAFHQSTDALLAGTTELLLGYDRTRGAVLAHFDELVALGLIDEDTRELFEHPTNPLGVREVAGLLAAIEHGATRPRPRGSRRR